jgi:hypothetical protein
VEGSQEGSEGGELVVLPNRRLCSNCEYGALSSSGVYCTFFREPILDEMVAIECGEYDPQPVVASVSLAKAGSRPAPETEPSNGRLTLDLTHLEHRIAGHLACSFSTLWGEVFDVKSADGLAAAVRWFAAEIWELVSEEEEATHGDEHADQASALPGAERP